MGSTPILQAAAVSADARFPLDGVSLLPVLRSQNVEFERPLFWRMNHRQQRALRVGDWKYLQVEGNEYVFNLLQDERERANLAPR